jgi:hypothetical protein
VPELSVKEIRLPELHLPEIKRDDIVRSLSEISLPEVDLAKAAPKFEWPRIDLPSVDVGKAIAGAAAAAPFGRRAPRSRWPLAIAGLVVAALAGWAIWTNEALRSRVAQGTSAIRTQFAMMRSNRYDRLDSDRDEPIAFPAAETAPIEDSPLSESGTSGATDYPAGLGSNNGDGMPALEETGSRS